MISVIVPAYNEENRITKTLDGLCAFLSAVYPPEEYEILVIDDGSTDKTSEVVSGHGGKNVYLLGYEENRGKGAAVKYGVQHAKGDYLVFTDADLPYAPENIEKAVCLMKEESAEVVLGSRKEKDNGRKYPLYRKLMSGGFSLVVNLILNLRVPDTQCGFKAFTKRAAETIFEKSTLSGWGFDVELIFLAKKNGFLMGRLPVELFHDNDGSKVRALRDAVQMFREVLTVKKNNKNGIYDT